MKQSDDVEDNQRNEAEDNEAKSEDNVFHPTRSNHVKIPSNRFIDFV